VAAEAYAYSSHPESSAETTDQPDTSEADAAAHPYEVAVMPYRSEKQRRYLHAKRPSIAARWDAKYGGKVKRKSTKRKRSK
jgi:hypothetical protein